MAVKFENSRQADRIKFTRFTRGKIKIKKREKIANI